MRRALTAAWLVAVAAAAWPSASAASAAPSCLGAALDDPPGDQAARFQGATVSQTGPNTDVVRAYFTFENGTAYAHMAFTELSRDLPAETEGIVWMMRWKNGQADNWVAADLFKDGTFFFSFGHYEGTTLVEDGRHTGEFREGPGGVISIPIPPTHGGTAGAVMTDPWVRVYGLFGAGGTYPLNLTADRGPDEGFGRTTTLARCAPAAPDPPAPQELRDEPIGVVLLGPSRLRARARAVRLRLRAAEPATALGVRLRRGKLTYGSATAERIHGTRKVLLRLRRPLRPGTYVLELSYAGADGRHRRQTFRLRARS